MQDSVSGALYGAAVRSQEAKDPSDILKLLNWYGFDEASQKLDRNITGLMEGSYRVWNIYKLGSLANNYSMGILQYVPNFLMVEANSLDNTVFRSAQAS